MSTSRSGRSDQPDAARRVGPWPKLVSIAAASWSAQRVHAHATAIEYGRGSAAKLLLAESVILPSGARRSRELRAEARRIIRGES